MDSPQPGPPVALAPSPVPPPLPPGYGCILVDVNEGVNRNVPAVVGVWLWVDRYRFPHPLQPGRWYLPVLAGRHRVKAADVSRAPLASTDVVVQEQVIHPLSFDFGRWRFRVRDGAGNDITRFGLWSAHGIVGVIFAVTAVISICLVAVFRGLPALLG